MLIDIDLLALVEKDGFQLVHYSNSRGRQYNGSCPFCSGHDRFRVQPHYGSYGWFACSQCDRKGSAVDYLILKRGYTRYEALAEVGWRPNDGRPLQVHVPVYALDERPRWNEPAQQWQEGASNFCSLCRRILWSQQGQAALAYLLGRGLTEKTIKAASIGYHPREAYGSAREWGKVVKLYQGIVIPWFFRRKIWRLTIRDERVASGEGRYKQIAGGSNGLYLADSLTLKRPAVVMTEGEFDALSVAQTCGDMVAVVATGTTQGSHTPRWVSMLACQQRVLVAFDAEEKGRVAAQWWLKRLANARRLRPLWEDANQMLQDGMNLRMWIARGLQTSDDLLSFCIMCGNEVAYYDEQGYAYCELHANRATSERTPLPETSYRIV